MDAKFNYFMEALTGFLSKGNQILNIGDASYKSVWFLFVFGMSHSTHRLFFFLSEILLREVLQFSARIVLHINSFA